MDKFISVDDAVDLDALIRKALGFKNSPLSEVYVGKNKTAGLLFLNPSLRTRISTQIAAKNLGMESIVFNVDKEGWALEFGNGAIMNGTTIEHVKDAAPVLGEYFDILCLRTFPGLKNKEEDYSEAVINAFVKYSNIPVISLESATLHPLQSLADVITITEIMKEEQLIRPKVVLTWAPHIKPIPQCVSNSFSQWMRRWDKADFVIANPEGYDLSADFTAGVEIMHDQDEALKNADFVYVKNWSSFNDYGTMPSVNNNWLLNNAKLASTNKAKIMHCLPVRRNVELSDEILDGSNSLVTKQAGNRVWAAQTVLHQILTTQ